MKLKTAEIRKLAQGAIEEFERGKENYFFEIMDGITIHDVINDCI